LRRVLGAGVEAVELGERVGDVGQIEQVLRFARAYGLEHGLAEADERLVATAHAARVVEPRPSLARAALEHLAHHAGLRERGAEQRSERAARSRAPARSARTLA